MAGNYVLLETIALTQTAASVTFDNLPTSGYTDLKVVMSSRGTGSLVYDTTKLVFNSTASGYSTRYIQGSGSAAISGTSGASTYIEIIDEGGNATTNTFSNIEIYIPNYRSSNNKSVSIDAVTETNATTVYMRLNAALWSNTAAITSITLTPDASAAYAANSTFSLYGVAAFGTTPVLAPKATGGNIVANDGTYWYHAFTSSGNFVPQVGLTADCLVIAGGASGGNGGGGAGGLLAYTSQSLTAINYTVTVGAGGAAGLVSGNGVNGNNSQFGSLTAATGGGKGAYTGAAAVGGSGGGGASGGAGGTAAGAAGTSGQGSAGGTGASGGTNSGGGGGGGATAVGGNGSAGVAGAGGAGSSAYSSWGVATTTGQNVSGTRWYAGGGGGGAGGTNSPKTPGAGGNGGGGAGGNTPSGGTPATAGTANTGGGGGGIYDNDPSGVGGSGIIIIRYPIA
jgi:hypothetical protein